MKKILPIVLLLIGSGAGVGAGIFLRPEPEEPSKEQMAAEEAAAAEEANSEAEPDPDNPPSDMTYVKLNNQFVVPIVKDKVVVALVVLSLSIEAPENQRDTVFRYEPKLRDSFLQVLFDHANIGGFDGAFTNANNMAVLRSALREVGQSSIGKEYVNDVLILEIARQDY